MTEETSGTQETNDPKPDVAANDGDAVTVAEAKAIFAERPDVASVLTVDGVLHRDGSLG